MVRVLAIVSVRNEDMHVGRCIRDLIVGGCDVHVIDNDSTDGTREIVEPFRVNAGVQISRLPWEGSFSLSDQLRAKRAIIESAKHDWIVHVDADEWLVSPVPNQSLAAAITEADARGYNVVNFHECVFIPKVGEDFCYTDYTALMRDYYFFQPRYPRLNRAWRRDAALDNTNSGGHALSGAEIRRSPNDLILRHYIVLSQEHARSKYVGRTFSSEDLARGWHGNRTVINERNVALRSHPAMHRLDRADDHGKFDLSRPLAEHYWEWPLAEGATE